MKPVRFVATSTALTYDARHDRVIRATVSIDTLGRRWERYDGGPDVLVSSPTISKGRKRVKRA